MRRWVLTLGFAAIGIAAIFFEATPFARPVGNEMRRWLAGQTLERESVAVTEVRFAGDGESIPALDAVLLIRAVERFAPRMIVFLNPIKPDSSASILRSRLSEVKVPIVFCGIDGVPKLPRVSATDSIAPAVSVEMLEPVSWPAGAFVSSPGSVTLLARLGRGIVPTVTLQSALVVRDEAPGALEGSAPGFLHAGGWLSPVDAKGATESNPLAGALTSSVELEDILLRVERGEQGEIDLSLEGMIRGKVLAACVTGDPGGGGIGVAAVCNRLTERVNPPWLAVVAVLVVASLPWWPGTRGERLLWAVAASLLWVLLALGIYQEFRLVASWAVVPLMPLLALLLFFIGNRADRRRQVEDHNDQPIPPASAAT